jgi:surface antigen
VIGGVIGNSQAHGHDKWAATAGGSILGVLLGGAIGQTVDSFDRSCAAQAVAYAPVGQPVQWRNQNYGREYQVMPMREYRNGGQYCREYQATANIDGRWQQVHGTACMEPDGSWQVVN